MKNYLVVGASGTVGSAVVQGLLSRGMQVRATTSNPAKVGRHKGVEWVYLNLQSGKGLQNAFSGVDRAFLLSPPGHADQYKILSPIVKHAQKAGVKKIVLMTAFGANAVENSPFRRLEVELEKSGLDFNIIRPNWFMQNFASYWVQGIREQGKILLPAGSAKVSFIDAQDIADVVVTLLTEDHFKNRAFDLTGNEALTHDQVAQILSQISHRQIRYEEIEPQVLKKGLMAAGLPEDYSDFMLMILGALKAGYSAACTSDVKTILGRDPIPFQTYAQKHKNVWV